MSHHQFRREEKQVEWKPRTTLGMLVAGGKISSMEQVFENGMRIQESEIVKQLLPDMKSQVSGKGGSVTLEILPGPRGLGLVAGEDIKKLLKLAGLKDAWTKSYGSTNTMASTTKAIFNALRSTYTAG